MVRVAVGGKDDSAFRYPEKLLHELFYEQAALSPEAVAVIDAMYRSAHSGQMETVRGCDGL